MKMLDELLAEANTGFDARAKITADALADLLRSQGGFSEEDIAKTVAEHLEEIETFRGRLLDQVKAMYTQESTAKH